jgi:hypothetical protein
MMALNAVDALVLWNFFPMHMRGVQPSFTDLMHGLLVIVPFLVAAIILAAIAFPGRFRRYTIATIVVTTALALSAVGRHFRGGRPAAGISNIFIGIAGGRGPFAPARGFQSLLRHA